MKLLFLGDLLVDYDQCPADILNMGHFILQKDYQPIINLEGPIVLSDHEKKRKKRGPNVKQAKGITDALSSLSPFCLCLANNHMMDYNSKGIEDTLVVLEQLGYAHTGAGRSLDEASEPFVFSDDVRQFSILNYGWKYEETVYADGKKAGCAPLEKAYVINSIKKEVEKNRRVILVFHWGFEFNLYPMPYYRKFAYDCIDAGAELVIGHHPHNVQPYEEYKGKRIYYSLGNFYMGSLREKFNVDYKIEGEKYFSDYGIGVIYDTVTGTSSVLGIRYDRKGLQSNISDVIPMENITSIKYDSKEYYEKTQKGIYGINPMLSLDSNGNERIMKRHLLICQFYSTFKGLRKNQFIDRCYMKLKRMYTGR